MKRLLPLALLALAGFAAAASAKSIGTLPIGNYRCETPGDVVGPAGIHVPEEDFQIVNASSYRIGDARGNYLLTGDMLYMTSGPFRGNRYRRLSRIQVRKFAADGSDSDLRCVRLMLAQ